MFLFKVKFKTLPQYPISFVRHQLPILPAFALTINKAQGQTLDIVGIHLYKQVFSHGQLYVAFTRVRQRENLFVYVNTADQEATNIVYPEVLV